jgi:hypothetical protein
MRTTWLPAVPHYLVLSALGIAALVVVIAGSSSC